MDVFKCICTLLCMHISLCLLICTSTCPHVGVLMELHGYTCFKVYLYVYAWLSMYRRFLSIAISLLLLLLLMLHIPKSIEP